MRHLIPRCSARYLMTTRDSLRCTFCRTAVNDYEGFTALKREAVEKLEAYVRFFRPARMIALTLEYVDFFRIPTVDGKAVLRDFFTICDEPNTNVFGTTLMLRKGFTTQPPGSNDLLTCELFNVPRKADQEPPGIHFRMEWRLFASKDLNWESSQLGKRLDDAHDRLLTCFWESFTPTGRSLFDPKEEKVI